MKKSETNPTLTLYGISPNRCDTIRKAHRYLQNQGVTFHFHDYCTDGLSKTLLTTFINTLGLPQMVNKRGLSWRKLSIEERSKLTHATTAIDILLRYPTLIKRPLLMAADGSLLVGFNETGWAQFIKEKTHGLSGY